MADVTIEQVLAAPDRPSTLAGLLAEMADDLEAMLAVHPPVGAWPAELDNHVARLRWLAAELAPQLPIPLPGAELPDPVSFPEVGLGIAPAPPTPGAMPGFEPTPEGPTEPAEPEEQP